MMKQIIKSLLPILEVFAAPFVLISSLILYSIRRIGLNHLPISRSIMQRIGVYPVIRHYYDPYFDKSMVVKPLTEDRLLPGIEMNESKQLELLKSFNFTEELNVFTNKYTNDETFHYKNESFESGDADYWYCIIRELKPKRIIEIGSGHSTRMARAAISKNNMDDPAYKCAHICIEPFEMPWLENLGIEVIREKVEDVNISLFDQLEDGDILFIDSSHMIRPQGDVVFEYLELLPRLKSGVIVHIHDIFTPKNYPDEWLFKNVFFWNEQYLLESFLSYNNSWEVLGALNYLHHKHFDIMKEKFPKLEISREPGSFYIARK